MLVKTKAIVLSKLKYGDYDLIVKCYTQHFGVKSYIIKHALRQKRSGHKAAYFQLLSLLDIEANHKDNRKLQYISECKPHRHFTSLHSNILKGSVVMFLAEILAVTLQEEEENPPLFNFLENAVVQFDEEAFCVNFHPVFLLILTKHLGFYPDTHLSHKPVFNMQEGKFQSKRTSKWCIESTELMLFKTLLSLSFDNYRTAKFSASERQQLIELLLCYFKLHIESFKTPRSLSVLNELYNRNTP